MFEAFKYRCGLHNLYKEYNRIDKSFQKHKKGLSGEQLELLRAETSSEIWPIIERINALKTRRYRQIADKLMLHPLDSKDKELWEDMHYEMGQALTNKGFWELNKLIRQEKRERREGVRVWCTLLAGVIGAIAAVIAAMTGLVVVLKQ